MGPNNKAVLSNFTNGINIDVSELPKGLSRAYQVMYSRYIHKRNQGDVAGL
jgi:hypothetical protein